MANLMADAVRIWDESLKDWHPGELGPGWMAGVDWAPAGDQTVIDVVQVELTGDLDPGSAQAAAADQLRHYTLPAPRSAQELTLSGRSWQIWWIPRIWLREQGWSWAWAGIPAGGLQ